MIASAHVIDPNRVCCNRGTPHRLMTPQAKLRHEDFATKVMVGSRCADCGRTFMTPTVRIPQRMFITVRGPAVIQAFVMKWGMAWIAHEAGRP